MNAANSAGASVPAPAAKTCRPINISALPGVPRNKLRCASLFRDVPREVLLSELRDCPQFSKLRLRPLLEDTRGGLRVLLLSESGYTAAQAAVYLASLSHNRGTPALRPDSDSFWDEIDLSDLEEPDSAGDILRRSLAVISPEALDPSLKRKSNKHSVVITVTEEDGFELELRSLDAPAALIAAPSGRVLTPGIVDQVENLSLRDAGSPLDLFIALQPGQVDLELLEELRFTHGFQTARLGRPDQDYFRRYLRGCAENLLIPIDPMADLDQVISNTRRFRGKDFCEADLESLISWAVQRHVQPPLQTKDLLFVPFKSGQDGWKELERMTGLDEVKNTLRRLLASAVLERRRRDSGKSVRPICRNLAFAGPPGTGKSVTARLAARILREEGCGTGRFVEAGREQLIGTYLGQTSPKIAELFEAARGGVLFIDEASALLDGGGDIYAVEAVNALVRHMELEPETMVILATYPGEMERLLSSNPGLKSRIARVLSFPSYDDAQLWEIFQGFAGEAEYSLPQGAETVCRDFFSALRRKEPELFGNGRDARRLFEGAVEELALRSLNTQEQTLSLQDLKTAAEHILAGSGGERRPIGFR